MSANQCRNLVHPVDISADVAESIAISWVEAESTPPTTLANLVRQYQGLVVYMDSPATPVEESLKAGDIAASLFDRLIEAASVKLIASSQAEAQLRRIQRKEESKLTWVQKCNRAIAAYEAGVRV